MSSDGDAIASLLSDFTTPSDTPNDLPFPDFSAAASSAAAAAADSSILFNRNAAEISPEEAAWADSLLTGAGPELSSDDDWTTLHEALLDTLCAAPDCNVNNNNVDDEMQQQEEKTVVSEQSEGDEDEDMTVLEGIFKVWDLGTPDEEDQLIAELKKALADRRVAVEEERLVDEMANLSLKPFSD